MLLCFSDAVTTSSTYLKGAGGQGGDGFPLPQNARIYRIDCWDGSGILSGSGNIAAAQGDRISLYAQVNGGNFDVYVRINGVNSTLVAAGLSQNSSLYATVHIQLI